MARSYLYVLDVYICVCVPVLGLVDFQLTVFRCGVLNVLDSVLSLWSLFRGDAWVFCLQGYYFDLLVISKPVAGEVVSTILGSESWVICCNWLKKDACPAEKKYWRNSLLIVMVIHLTSASLEYYIVPGNCVGPPGYTCTNSQFNCKGSIKMLLSTVAIQLIRGCCKARALIATLGVWIF